MYLLFIWNMFCCRLACHDTLEVPQYHRGGGGSVFVFYLEHVLLSTCLPRHSRSTTVPQGGAGGSDPSPFAGGGGPMDQQLCTIYTNNNLQLLHDTSISHTAKALLRNQEQQTSAVRQTGRCFLSASPAGYSIDICGDSWCHRLGRRRQSAKGVSKAKLLVVHILVQLKVD